MTVTNLPIPKCSMGDGLDKLGYASDHLNSARGAIAHLLEQQLDQGTTCTIECIILALTQAAADLKTGLDAVSFEHKAFKIWEAKNAQPAGEARS
jgi:hypothetical protein